MKFWLLILFNLATFLTISAQQCGSQAGNALCANGLCCSQFGYCGSTPDYCSASNNCQSQCTGSTTPGTVTGLGSIITSALFDQMLRFRARFQSNGFYIYNAFINAAGGFSSFGTTGDSDTRKREVAAFLAQTSHETDKEMRGRSYSPSPPRGYGRRGRSPSPRDRSYSGSRGRDLPTSLLVLNLRYDFRPEDLRRPFGRFGPLKDVYLPRDYYSGRGFGFVQFVDPNDAAEAKYEMDGQILLGRQLTVVFAEENKKKPSDMRVRESRGGSGRSSDRRRSTCRYSRSP